jgi:hypothetical protein
MIVTPSPSQQLKSVTICDEGRGFYLYWHDSEKEENLERKIVCTGDEKMFISVKFHGQISKLVIDTRLFWEEEEKNPMEITLDELLQRH